MTSNMGVLNNEKRDTHEKMIMMMVSVFVLLSMAACHSVETGNNADEHGLLKMIKWLMRFGQP